MRVLLTGYEGFIGRSLLESQLIQIDYMMSASDNKLTFRTCDSPEFQRSFLLEELDKVLPTDITHILHFGAITSTISIEVKSMFFFNTSVTNALVDFACKRGIQLVFASSAAVYGDSPIMKEDHLLNMPRNLYAKSKWDSERYIEAVCKCEHLHITTLRLFNIYGRLEERKGAMSSIIWRFLYEANKKKSLEIFQKEGLSLGSQSRDFVFVDDLISFLQLLLKKGSGTGLINFGSGKSHSFAHIADLVSFHVDGLKVEALPIPSEYSNGYQWYTQADTTKFRTFYPSFEFTPINEGLSQVQLHISKVFL